MATWRRRALERFPELRQDLQDKDYSLYTLFGDLVPMAHAAHRDDDQAALANIYGFSRWCFFHADKTLWNPAGVSFYEHLFGAWSLRHKIISWLQDEEIKNARGLWELVLPVEKYQEVEKLIRARGVGPK